LANLGDIYVNDAFGTAHRAHASTAGVTAYISTCVAGLLIERELEYLAGKLDVPAKPFVVIMGGKKVSDKIEIITSLLPKADAFLIGGAMAYTFLKAQGYQVGKSLVEADKLDLALEILKKAAEHNTRFLLPVDSRHTAEFKEGAETQVCAPFPDGGFIPPIVKGSISATAPLISSTRRSRPLAPSFGMVRWACSRSKRLPRAPALWPKPWPPRLRSASSVVAIP